MRKRSMTTVVSAFKHWRAKRKTRSSVTPPRLRRLALAMCAEAGDDAVCEQVGLSSYLIWKWRREQQGHKPKPKLRPARRAQERSPAPQGLKFFEIAPKEVVVSGGSISVEWSRSDGSKMRLSGVSLETAQGLSTQFLQNSGEVRP
jgi:hypothetical protein